MSDKAEKKKGGPIKIVVAVAIIAAVFFAANHFGLTDMIQDFGAMQEWFLGLGMIAYVVFILIYIVASVFMLPAAPLTIIAGITFGSILGGVMALIAATFGATAAFIVARYVARDMIVNRFKDNPLFKKIDDGFEQNGVSFLILTRLVPVFPYNVQNYIYGLTSINIVTFTVVSFITMAPGAFIYAFMAGEIVTHGFSVTLMIQFAIAGVVLFLVSLIPKYIAKKKGINLKD
ncbi:MAG: TVP38/TMEM64 family protein [Defluviitaleaceae bacterium]|nr:TVP38/TMEM64 family protein [Defluviitaleaceae bacterium]